ncbi:hypothetical protein RE628_04080 [Paenibacillus sp. D2_2]|uniref:hypothetical protein n=1 Tax=Paenibacillus sp. D2_2 TaxID=3073092 RepID=UPI0028169222|nr:hypothetical protein [Paenibacillus sp. D2_2]WMT41683.1 hypothetical protein RE628_04080 [Paenibacillus sp. D2_2]
MQYAVMSPALQQSTKQQFADHFWVTGGSSPHMGPVTEMATKSLSSDKVEVSFDYPLVASGETIDIGKATLIIEKESWPYENNWGISAIYLLNPGDTGLMIGAEKMK